MQIFNTALLSAVSVGKITIPLIDFFVKSFKFPYTGYGLYICVSKSEKYHFFFILDKATQTKAANRRLYFAGVCFCTQTPAEDTDELMLIMQKLHECSG